MINTERCHIRRFNIEDIEDFMVYRNDENWMKYQGFKCLNKEEYEKALINDNLFEDGLQLVIIEKKSNTVIGDLYVKKEDDIFWIGYTISPKYSKQGFALESVQAFLKWLKINKMCKQVKAGTLPNNIPSINLLLKVGFIFSHYDNEYSENIYKKILE